MNLKTEKCSEHYGFLCIRMDQGSRGMKTQKSYFCTKIAQCAEYAPSVPKPDHGAPQTSKWKVLQELWFFMHKNAPGITGHQNPKVLFSHKNCTMGRKCTTGTKIRPQGTSNLKTEKCSEHYGFLCIRMHQGWQGTKTQKSYFRTKIVQMVENAPPTPKLDHRAPRTSKRKRVLSFMVLYA